MKILAMSLLRLGDIIMISGVLKALKDKNPGSELHLLINSQFADITKLMPYVDKVILFDRQRVQRGLGEIEEPLYGSYFYIENIIRDLNAQTYDLAVNFTQNIFSAKVLSLINAREKLGLTVDSSGKFVFGSAWFERLNSRRPREPLHYIDYMIRGSGVNKGTHIPVLIRNGVAEETEKLNCLADKKYVVVQALTSDQKKNWGLRNYESTIKKIIKDNPGLNVVLLGAPSEEEALTELRSRLEECSVSSLLSICNLSTAFAIVSEAKLVITGDTGIKHLATAADVPIIEISIGSSDMRFTGAYSPKAWIVQSPIACAPCEHRGPCKMSRHLCAESISSVEVASLANSILKNSQSAVTENIFKCEFLPGGVWCARKPAAEFFGFEFEELTDGL